jgi:hypothetical protein
VENNTQIDKTKSKYYFFIKKTHKLKDIEKKHKLKKNQNKTHNKKKTLLEMTQIGKKHTQTHM